jgi:hypothetical protein
MPTLKHITKYAAPAESEKEFRKRVVPLLQSQFGPNAQTPLTELSMSGVISFDLWAWVEVELPTSRLSGDRRRVGNPARNRYTVDGQRDLP